MDIDDDNDGILDVLELAACEVPEIDKSTITVSSELTWASTLSLILDDVVSNNVYSNPNGQNTTNKTYLKFEFTNPTILTDIELACVCLLYTSPSPRDQRGSRMPSSA